MLAEFGRPLTLLYIMMSVVCKEQFKPRKSVEANSPNNNTRAAGIWCGRVPEKNHEQAKFRVWGRHSRWVRDDQQQAVRKAHGQSYHAHDVTAYLIDRLYQFQPTNVHCLQLPCLKNVFNFGDECLQPNSLIESLTT